MNIEILSDTLFKGVSFIEHGYFTRQGGVSKGPFSSLNCSYHQDNKIAVKENRRRAMVSIGKSPGSLVTFKDMHGNKAVIVDHPWDDDQIINADAMVTKSKNVVLGALCADCPLILFAEENTKTVGIAHAGWRGAKAGIIESTLEKITSLGAKTERIMAAIGPCIAQDSYEVGPEFYEAFLKENSINEKHFQPAHKKGYFLFDLRNYIYCKLQKLGIQQISYLDMDTYKNEDQFFSRRRSYHKAENEYGCQLGFICLK